MAARSLSATGRKTLIVSTTALKVITSAVFCSKTPPSNCYSFANQRCGDMEVPNLFARQQKRHRGGRGSLVGKALTIDAEVLAAGPSGGVLSDARTRFGRLLDARDRSVRRDRGLFSCRRAHPSAIEPEPDTPRRGDARDHFRGGSRHQATRLSSCGGSVRRSGSAGALKSAKSTIIECRGPQFGFVDINLNRNPLLVSDL
jgi:hypothetical protein